MKKKYPLNPTMIIPAIVVMTTWLGLIRNNISIHFGGVVFFGVSCAVMVLSLFPFKFYIKIDKRPYIESLVALTIFSVLYGTLSFLYKSGPFTMMMGFRIPVFTYNIILNYPIWIANYIIIIRSTSETRKRIISIYLWMLLYDVIVTFIALGVDESFSKNNAAGIIDESSYVLSNIGAMGYELIYCLTIIVPTLFYIGFIRKKKIAIALFFCSLILVYKSAFLIATVALLFNIILSLILEIKNKHLKILLILIVLVVTIVLVINPYNLGLILNEVARYIKIPELQLRVNQLSKLFMYGDHSGASLKRFDLYLLSLNGIKDSPILGQLLFDNYYFLSEHSTILDIWAAFGILPLSIFCYSIYRIYSNTRKILISDRAVLNINKAALATFFLISITNPILSSPLVMLTELIIMPLFMEFCTRANHD